eukprot:CAMPEP_0119322308 /NCGR_PEP_ID=MMETSP1333-20130426/57793_1 /TAXON_ID=418940 /ORGANISM="Scyphosphaera apsteinii, Strain RCC1455" /LENGTH=352 /DNA_ID=CAMNT_0007329501 /DNA_START=73 /DNA_END=1131 /DNA_ORIENTATION=+
MTPRPIITPSANPARWDAACVANPVVLPPRNANEDWLCFYYGNRGGYGDLGGWAGGAKCFLPTGWCGMARSANGISWTPVDGMSSDKAVFGPGEPDAWDGLHVGVGDVIRLSNGTLVMFYLGGSHEPVSMGPAARAGIRMRIGRALSNDGGMSWVRDTAPVVDVAPEEGLFASWPRVLTADGEDGEWYMTYHAFNGSHWSVFSATSNDLGASWVRQGRALAPGAEGAFDSSGIGTRAMCEWQGKWLMCFEGVGDGGPFAGTHKLGVAVSEDAGATWSKLTMEGALDPGGPIVEPGGPGEWTAQVVGTPYLVPMDGGALRLYFCAKTTQTNMSIGCLESVTGEVEMDAWQPLC